MRIGNIKNSIKNRVKSSFVTFVHGIRGSCIEISVVLKEKVSEKALHTASTSAHC